MNVLTIFHDIGLSVERAALVAAIIGPAGIASRVVELFLGRRLSPLSSAIFWSLLLPAALVTLIAFGASAAIPFTIAYGMSNGMATISLSVLLMTYFDIKNYPTLMGNIGRPILVAQAGAPLLAAPLLDAMTTEQVLSVALFISITAVLFLVFIRQLNLR